MSLLLELEPETEQALHQKAARLGVPVESYAAGVLRREVAVENKNADSRRKAAIGRARGLLSNISGSVDELLCERRNEVEREMRKGGA